MKDDALSIMRQFSTDLFIKKKKSFLQILTCLSWSLNEWHLPWISKRLSLSARHLTTILEVRFISNKHFYCIHFFMTANGVIVLLQSFEGLSISDVVNQHDAVSSSDVRRSDCLESLLACCVPDLILYSFPIVFDCFDLKIDSNGGKILFGKSVISIP